MTSITPFFNPNNTYYCDYGSTPFLTPTNYHQWAHDMELFLGAEEAREITLGEEAAPTTRRAAADYRKRANIAAAMINFSCHPSIRAYTAGLRDPHEMWTKLKERLDPANSRSSQNNILRQFNQLRPDSSGLLSYVGKLRGFQWELANTAQAISGKDFINHLITTLPSSFNTIIDIIFQKPADERTAENVVDTLIEWERIDMARKAEVGSSSNTDNTITSANMLAAHSRNRSKDPRKSRGNRVHKPWQSGRLNRRQPVLSCWQCGRQGHRQDECRTKQRGNVVRK